LPGELQEEFELDTPCDILTDMSGRGFLPSRLANDPFVGNLYMDDADGCPTTMEAMMEVLKRNDDSGCQGGDEGLKTRVISETAKLLGQDDSTFYRSVTSRQCGGRDEFGLLFSNAGLDPESSDLPGGIEVIAFDEVSGVFNYYKEVDNEIQFFGSSHDYVLEGPGGPGLTDVRGCANCHTGGGLIMKELEAPWLHWEAGSTRSPGVDDIIAERKEVFGDRADGINLEGVVKAGNRAWTKTRAQILNDGDLASLALTLQPLFCPTEVNLRTGSQTRLSSDFILDPRLNSLSGSRTVSFSGSQYRNILEAIGSFVPGTDETDTVEPFTFLERSQADQDYIAELIRLGIVDKEFVEDALMLDFTRPLLSDDRCSVVDFAPELDTADRTADKVRQGFIDSLNQFDLSSDPAAADFLASLELRAAGEQPDHASVVGNFFDKCRARQEDETVTAGGSTVSAFLADVLKLRSLQRKLANLDADLCQDESSLSTVSCLDGADGFAERAIDVLEFAETMAFDLVRPMASSAADNPLRVHPSARLSPFDCSLATTYVSTQDIAPADDASSCEVRGCDSFEAGATCQCNALCLTIGDCCADFDAICQ
jgi:hypothetical protein